MLSEEKGRPEGGASSRGSEAEAGTAGAALLLPLPLPLPLPALLSMGRAGSRELKKRKFLSLCSVPLVSAVLLRSWALALGLKGGAGAAGSQSLVLRGQRDASVEGCSRRCCRPEGAEGAEEEEEPPLAAGASLMAVGEEEEAAAAAAEEEEEKAAAAAAAAAAAGPAEAASSSIEVLPGRLVLMQWYMEP
jgi:hypothetical protein